MKEHMMKRKIGRAAIGLIVHAVRENKYDGVHGVAHEGEMIQRIWARLICVKVSRLWERIEYGMPKVAHDGEML